MSALDLSVGTHSSCSLAGWSLRPSNTGGANSVLLAILRGLAAHVTRRGAPALSDVPLKLSDRQIIEIAVFILVGFGLADRIFQ